MRTNIHLFASVPHVSLISVPFLTLHDTKGEAGVFYPIAFAWEFIFDILSKIIIERLDRFQNNHQSRQMLCFLTDSVPGIIILTGILFCLLYFCSKTSFSVTFIVYIRKLCIDRTKASSNVGVTRWNSYERKFTLWKNDILLDIRLNGEIEEFAVRLLEIIIFASFYPF